MPGTVERVNRFVWPGMTGETNPHLKRSFVWDAETVRRAILDAVWRVAANGVTRECLADGSVAQSKFATAVQESLLLQDAAVTVLKLAANAFSADATGRLKMEDLFATGAKFQDGTITAAQLATAVGAYTIPAGTMLWFAAERAPTGWLECNGQEQLVSTYPALASACGTRWGTPAGGALYFKLPDFRGYFERGWANGATTDPDKGTRVGGDHVGSSQGEVVKTHTHTITSAQMKTPGIGTGDPPPYVMHATTDPGNTSIATNGMAIYQTRPENRYLMKIIKT